MKTLIAALAAVATVTAVAAPAAAQPYRDHRYDHSYDRGGYDINRRQERLDRYIDQGVRRGSINRWEANRLRGEFQDIARLEARYRVNGLTGWERADLDRRFDRLEVRVQQARSDTDRRDYGYGYGYGQRR